MESTVAFSFDQTWLVFAVETPNHGQELDFGSYVGDRPKNFFF